MSERSLRPAAVWIAIIILLANAVVYFGLIFFGTHETVLASGLGGMSFEDWVNTFAFGTSGFSCLVSVILLLYRNILGRYLTLLPLSFVSLFVVFNVGRDAVTGETSNTDIIFGIVGGTVVLIFPILLVSVLLFLSKNVNAYLKTPIEDNAQQLLEPPPPPSSFS